jgi:cyclic dehypoxanthinyl futalosine synthase
VRRRLHPEPIVTYIIDRNVNYTNICDAYCTFCAFYRKPGSTAEDGAYTHPHEVIGEKIRETIALGGNQILIQGGHNPDLGIEYYESLFRYIKENFGIHIHGLSPPEIDHISRVSGIGYREVLERLRAAGLGTLPGGGAEILVDRVRNRVAKLKVSADGWLDVMRIWHEMGGRSTATMMFGHVETFDDRVEHLRRLRDLQDETGGFTAFIPWIFQSENTRLHVPMTTAADYLKTVAIARIFLDNFANLQSSWVTMGPKIGQVALRYGCNDFGSIMIEENVVSAAGAHYEMVEADMTRVIRDAGFVPARRNVLYELIEAPVVG